MKLMMALGLVLVTGCGTEKLTQNTTSAGINGCDVDQPGLVIFNIPEGTGNGNWNDAANPIEAQIGDTIRICNYDSVAHQLHTNGTPCGHGDRIAALPASGVPAYDDCQVSQAFDGRVYDHIYGRNAAVYIRTTP